MPVSLSGSLLITGSITTSGTITAQTLVVQTISSSIEYASGSNIFGNLLTNTQTFTGSVNITGSQTVFGNLGVGGAAGEKFGVIGPLGQQGFIRWSDGVTTSAFLGITGSTAFIHGNNFSLGLGANGSNNYSPTIMISGSNVGIGTTSPSYPLHLKNATFSQLYIEGGTFADLILYNSSGTANLRTMVMRQTRLSYLSFFSANDNGTINTNNILTLTNSGSVGIGTSIPTSYTNRNALAINGSSGGLLEFQYTGTRTGYIYANSGELQIQTTSDLTASTILNLNSNGSSGIITLQTAGTERMRIRADGSILFSTTSTLTTDNNTLTAYSTNGYLYLMGGSTGLALTANGNRNNTIYLSETDNNIKFFTNATGEKMRITNTGDTQPGTDNAYSLGVSGTRWSAVWAANGTIQTSDEREKKDIIDSDLGLDFVSKLRPVSFKWKVGQNVVTSEVIKDEEGNPILDEDGKEKTETVITPREGVRTHYGLIAQEVETLLDGKDFGGFIHDTETDVKGLRYDQFVPLLIKAIQELSTKLDEATTRIKTLESR